MNTTTTISRTDLFEDTASRAAFRAAWKVLSDQRALSSAHMALYALLMGRPVGRAFSPITNSSKINNGQAPWAAAMSAAWAVSRNGLLPPFSDLPGVDIERLKAAAADAMSEQALVASRAQ